VSSRERGMRGPRRRVAGESSPSSERETEVSDGQRSSSRLVLNQQDHQRYRPLLLPTRHSLSLRSRLSANRDDHRV
jgi:hypothetical protein